ncbi:MAG: hypothetical protein Q9183_003990 [Haloplaca sp. 2 TL-2023]
MAQFRGYAVLPRYQYHDVRSSSLQFSSGPLYDRPPDPPVFEPPTNHPFDKAEGDVSPAEDEIPAPENHDLADVDGDSGEANPGDDTPATSEPPEEAPLEEATSTESVTGDGGFGGNPPANPDDEAQESNAEGGDAKVSTDPAEASPALEDEGEGNGAGDPKQAEFAPIEPGEGDDGQEGDQAVSSLDHTSLPDSLLNTYDFSHQPLKMQAQHQQRLPKKSKQRSKQQKIQRQQSQARKNRHQYPLLGKPKTRSL